MKKWAILCAVMLVFAMCTPVFANGSGNTVQTNWSEAIAEGNNIDASAAGAIINDVVDFNTAINKTTVAKSLGGGHDNTVTAIGSSIAAAGSWNQATSVDVVANNGLLQPPDNSRHYTQNSTVQAIGAQIGTAGNFNQALAQTNVYAANIGLANNDVSATGAEVIRAGSNNLAQVTASENVQAVNDGIRNNTVAAVGASVAGTGEENWVGSYNQALGSTYMVRATVYGDDSRDNSVTAIGARVQDSGSFNIANGGYIVSASAGYSPIDSGSHNNVFAVGAQILNAGNNNRATLINDVGATSFGNHNNVIAIGAAIN